MRAAYALFQAFVVCVTRWSRWQWPESRLAVIPRFFSADLAPGSSVVVTVLWTPAPDAVSLWHVSLVFERRGQAWWFDPAARFAVMPVPGGDEQRFIARMKPRWQVTCTVPTDTAKTSMLPEPYSCVTLVRSVLGMDEPLIHTPEQLLVALWEKSDE